MWSRRYVMVVLCAVVLSHNNNVFSEEQRGSSHV